MPDQPPILWVLWNPRLKRYVTYQDDRAADDESYGDAFEDTYVYTDEERTAGAGQPYRREHGYVWVRLTPEIQNGE